jgi:topoisomerase-4 subunit A
VGDGVEACRCIPITEDVDTVGIIGQNRKLLVFPLEEIPEMNRGRGVILQRYKDGEMADLKLFQKEQGLQWPTGERTRTETDLTPWEGRRASAGRLPPRGFPRSNRFT